MGLPNNIKTWFEKQDWYLSVRYTKPVLAAWLLFRPSVRKELENQNKLYLSVLESSDNLSKIIFDIGAHEGFLTNIFVKAGYSVIAVEPEKRNIAVLKSRFKNNASVTVVEAAISDKPGEISFYETKNSHAFGTVSKKWKDKEKKEHPGIIYGDAPVTITAVTIDKLIEQYGQPVFIKTDVEGYEEFALHGLNQNIPLISFEAILPDFLKETESCVAHLVALNNGAKFNFAINNQLQCSKFCSSDEMLSKICQMEPQTIEIFGKLIF